MCPEVREGRIIYPSDGPLNQAMQDALHTLRTVFGGSTVYPATAHWANAGELMQENVYICDVAYEPTYENDCKLYAIAQDIRKALSQIEVYVRYSNGHVQFVSAHSIAMDNGEEHTTDDIQVPDFINMMDAVNRLTGEHTPVGERVASFEYLTRELQAKPFKQLSASLNALSGAGADWGDLG